MKIMGTGSRSMILAPDKLEVYKHLEDYILSLVPKDPHLMLISGMAEGWDEAIAKVGMRNSIPYTVVIPTKDYGTYYWKNHSLTKKNRIRTFEELLVMATNVIFLEDLYGSPKFLNRHMTGIPGPHYHLPDGWMQANFARNLVMVEMADAALVYEPKSSGTAHCLRVLQSKGVPYRIYPKF